MKFSTIEEALEDLRQGKIIIVTDDEDRENEGDFICASEFADTENINFMAVHGKGLICMPMSAAMGEKLGLSPMVTRIRITMRLHLQKVLIMWKPPREFLRWNALSQH